MKTYTISRGPAGVIATVFEEDPERPGSGDGTAYPLPHLAHHSPDGFEFGYGGSGPADLARSIVGDLLGQREPHPADYQAVKFALVAPLEGDGPHDISEEAVRRALAGKETP